MNDESVGRTPTRIHSYLPLLHMIWVTEVKESNLSVCKLRSKIRSAWDVGATTYWECP